MDLPICVNLSLPLRVISKKETCAIYASVYFWRPSKLWSVPFTKSEIFNFQDLDPEKFSATKIFLFGQEFNISVTLQELDFDFEIFEEFENV